MRPLFARFPLGIQTTYSELKQRALEQSSLLLGTPGSVSERTEAGRRYFYRQFYDSEGAKGAEHIGPVDDASAMARAAEIRGRIADTNELIASARMLTGLGYVHTDARTQAVLVVLANADLFRAEALVIGSHAYGALLNDLGAKVTSFATEDVDIARGEPLAIGADKRVAFADLLATSRLPLLPIPSLDRKGPSTSFSVPPRFRGRARMRVDLLAPTAGSEPSVVAVPELAAHATGLPFLRYLLGNPMDTVAIGTSAIVPIKVPRPERLAWHKLLVSELRSATSDKKQKDIEQAAVLLAVLTEDAPDALEEAFAVIPRSGRSKVKRAAAHAGARLMAAGHVRAVELLRDLLGRKPAA